MTDPELTLLRQKLAGLLLEIERMQNEATDLEFEIKIREAENED